ncbi:hypothetical protein [Terriglobus tenax]|uniref:hypothetical protein n=1 Tax=Terriglobus tenax TaxID=1111115 RepID=UPI0021E040C3|nr:hypothetical protein [Terriglobus tenax]
MSIHLRAVTVVLLTAWVAPRAQQAADPPASALHEQAVRLFSEAKPYIDLPLQKLEHQVEELHGLKADEDQEKLEDVLESASAAVLQQLPRVPNLVAREDVAFETEQSQMVRGAGFGRRGGGGVYGVGDRQLAVIRENSYEFVIRRQKDDEGIPVLQESRRDPRTEKEPEGQQLPQALGFSQLWMLFTREELHHQRYRYLGTQKVHGQVTNVLAFAQVPERVSNPGVIQTTQGPVPMLQQGIVWIDEQTGQILRIRTDLLAPVPQIQAESISSTVEFSAVRLPGLEELLWLPKHVDLTWTIQGQYGGEIHRYSRYRLYKAKIRILIPKDEDLVRE